MIESIVVDGALATLFIGGLITLNRQMAKRPTFTDTDERYKKTEVCDEIHRAVNEKLECLPEVKDTLARLETKVDIILKNNGK